MSLNTTISIHSWFKQIFERNNLSAPNEQPLYQYQLTESEYFQLKTLLKQTIDSSTMRKKDKAWCAAFCMLDRKSVV